MKKFIIALAILLPLGILIWVFFWGKSIWDNIKIKPYFVSADLKGLNLQDVQDVLAGQERTIDSVLGMEIKNDSDSNITFSGLKAKLYYQGTLLAETSDALADKKFTATAHNLNAPLNVTDSVTLRFNDKSVQLLADKVTAQLTGGKKPEIDYTIELSIYGIPILKWFPIKGTFPW